MKKILNKLEFHYTYLLIAITLVLTGLFKNLIAFTSLILIHELGHVIIAKINKIKINKISIYPYGGMTKLDLKLNTNTNKELGIAISGIIFQSLYFLLVSFFYQNNLIGTYTYSIYRMYHYSMLIFNILPVYPLDGYKILNLALNKLFCFKLSNTISIIISIFFMTAITIYISVNPNLSYLLILSLMLTNLINLIKQNKNIYHLFLLERYLYNFNFKKLKIIDNYKKMHKDHKHIIKRTKEEDFLRNLFDFKGKL